MSVTASRRGLAWAVVAMLLASLWWRVIGTPALILFAAIAPALVYAVLIALLDRREPEPASLLVAAFMWGAVVAAPVAATFDGLAQAWMASFSSGSEARILTPMLIAPVVEELAKAAALLVLIMVWSRELRGVLDGIVYGALVGLGFAVSENVLYLSIAALQGGYAGLLRSAYLRAILYGVNHAAFTATTGAAIGYARATPSRALAVLVSLIGLTAAVGQHVLWNTVASEAIQQMLCGSTVAGGACRDAPTAFNLYVTVPLMVALFVAPGIMTLLAVAAASRR